MYGFKIIYLVLSLNILGLCQFNWQQVNGPTGGKFDLLSINQLGELVIASNEFVYFSTNQGGSWTKKSNGLTTDLNFTSLLSDTIGTFISTVYSGIFKFDKNQNQWIQFNNGLPTFGIMSEPYPKL